MPRPERPLGRVTGALALGVAWFVVAHEGGSGWVQLLGDILAGTLFVGLAGGALPCARARVEVTSSPADAVAGLPLRLRVSANTRLRLRPVDPPGPPAFVGGHRGVPDEVTVVPEHRGVYGELVAELASAAPFGMLWWRRTVRSSLPGEMVVGPRLGAGRRVEPTPEDGIGGAPVPVPAVVGEARGVRDYHSGDHRRWVHWPATAHRGELSVREMEAPASEPVVVEAVLPVDPESAEREAETVLGTVVALLGAGREVVLVTTEAGGARRAPVADRRAAGRRLARAVAVTVTAGSSAQDEEPPGAGAAGLVVVKEPADGRGPVDGAGLRRGGWARAVERVRQANAPGPPEHSITLRLASAGALLVGFAAVRSQSEISTTVLVLATLGLVAGMLLSYRLRLAPPGWLKAVLAVAAIVAFVWFFHQLSGQGFYDVATVEDPLATLFVTILAIHCFDVPARRDLAFSLGGSAVLMAVAAAQATDMSFGLYALAWMVLGLGALLGLWASASGGGRIGARTATAAVAAIVIPAAVLLLVLPAPDVAGHFDFPIAAGRAGALPFPFALAGDGLSPSEPARPGSPNGPTRVGGFTGFATRLDTALRATPGGAVVMRVRAQFPTYWVGEIFDRWDGVSWDATKGVPTVLDTGSPFTIPSVGGQAGSGQSDLQTFYVVSSSPNLVFHADGARQVWFPTRQVFLRQDSTIVSPIGLGRGAIYTVRSVVPVASAGELRAAGLLAPTTGLSTVLAARDLQLPHPYPQVEALASHVTAGDTNTYDKVEDLIAWIGSHTHYSTDIPPLPPGADTVDEFLFGDRVGFCEQISTSLAVMLRSLGIPAREAVGFVPGPYNPVTDLYTVQERDAHAWVQVWFPGYGWQDFDPTAVVTPVSPSPGGTLLGRAGHDLDGAPAISLGTAVAALVSGWMAVAWWRRRPRTLALALSRRMERAGARAGRPRRAGETLADYAATLEQLGPAPAVRWTSLATDVEAAAYGDAVTATAGDAALRRWRSQLRAGRWRRRGQPMDVGDADWRDPRASVGRRSR